MEKELNKNKKYVLLTDSDLFFERFDKYSQEAEEENTDLSIRHKNMYQKYLSLAESKELNQISDDFTNKLEYLYKKYPHAHEILDVIEGFLLLQKNVNKNISKINPNILIHGDAGSGKTSLAKDLCRLFGGEDVNIINLGLYNSSFSIAGLDMGYASGAPGKIAKILNESDFANTWILLDEFDKGSDYKGGKMGEGNSSYIPFYTLLEKDSAKNFEDVALDLKINTQYITWILTANNIESIPEPFLSRCLVFKLEIPTKKQIFSSIIPSLWNEFLQENNAYHLYENFLNAKVRSNISLKYSIRDLKSILSLAASRAIKRNHRNKNNKIEINLTDVLNHSKKQKKQHKMGFL